MRLGIRCILLNLTLVILLTSCGQFYCDIVASGDSKYCDRFYHRKNQEALIRGGVIQRVEENRKLIEQQKNNKK